MNTPTINRSFLKLLGSKNLVTAPQVLAKLPKIVTSDYCELFFGVGSIWSNIECRGKVFLNDSNAHAMWCFYWAKHEPKEFSKLAKSYFSEENKQKNKYYELREKFTNEPNGTIEHDAMYPYIVTICDGDIRTNKQGVFNQGYHLFKNDYRFKEEEFWVCANKLQKEDVIFCFDDFEVAYNKIKHTINERTLFYLDPPYLSLSNLESQPRWQRWFTEQKRHIHLAMIMIELYRKGHKVALSNYNNTDVKIAYRFKEMDGKINIIKASTSTRRWVDTASRRELLFSTK